MNSSSLAAADLTTHLRVIAVALFFSMLVIWAAISARITDRAALSAPQVGQPISATHPIELAKPRPLAFVLT